MFWVVAWVQVELRSLSSFRRCMLFDWLLLLLLLFKLTFSRDCEGWWDPSSNVCFSAMADCIIAKSHAFNRALKCYKSFKPGFSSLMKSFKPQFCNVSSFFCQGLTASHGDILVQGSLTAQKEHARFYLSTAWWSNRATLLVLQPLQMLQICPLLSMPDNGMTPNTWSCPGIIIIRHSVRWISGAVNEHYLMFWAPNRAQSAEKTRDAQSTKSKFYEH